VKGAMLAGALFNRAADIFTKLVELQSVGIEIQSDNALMRECGRCLQEALGLGRLVLHRSGEEGIDELWGEPFKAFSIPLEDFYESRYVKIALTLRDIDLIADAMVDTSTRCPVSGHRPHRDLRQGCPDQDRNPAYRPGHLRHLDQLRDRRRAPVRPLQRRRDAQQQ
jgi:hypothetical protein